VNLAPKIVSQFESLGGSLALDGDGSIRYRVPKESPEVRTLLEMARAERQAILDYLRNRAAVPAMPLGVRLVEWNLKEPPVAIEICTVVVNPPLFAKTTLAQLGTALANPERWVGWSVPQLLDRLAQVGVVASLEPAERE
jgi:hypothetical protein